MQKKLTNKDFIEKLKQINSSITVIEEYKGSNTKILCRCNDCNNEWRVTPSHLFSGRGCPVCGKKNSALKRMKPHSVFLEEVNQANPNVQIISEYTGNKNKVRCKCTKCNYEWDGYPKHLRKGIGCPKCAGNARKTHYDFVNEIESIHPNIEILSEYKSADEKVSCKCTICGHVWSAVPNGLLSGNGCPQCFKRYRTSFAEQSVLFYVKKHFDDAVGTYNANNVEFDIYIDHLRTAIEYDGYYWHKDRLDQDNAKDNYCYNNGIELIRIREHGLDKTKHAFNIFRKNNSKADLSKKIINLLKMLNISNPDVNLEADRIIIMNNYYSNIRNNSLQTLRPDIAVEWHPVNNLNITPGMIPLHSGEKFWWICPNCGFEWQSSPDHRSRGRGCPHCKNEIIRQRKTKDHDTFLKEVSEKSPEITVLDSYINSRTPILCSCKMCNNIFYCTPHDLLQGRHCPICTKKSMQQNIRKTHEEFLVELKVINSQVIPIEKYTTAKSPILFKCKKCGYTWKSTPDRIRRGVGCPKCAGNARLSQEGFVLAVKEKNPNIEVLGEYKKSKEKIKYRCKLCGYTGEMRASHLKEGHGCPYCSKKKK